MNKENPHRYNPLQGVGLKKVLEELVTYYGFDILYAYLNMNCFKTNPSIDASAKFLKKTDWARHKVELFYLYQYKNLPKVSSEQFTVEPRERVVPEHHKPGKPAVLSIEDAERLQQKRDKNAASYMGENSGSSRQYNERRSARHHGYKGLNAKTGNTTSDDSHSPWSGHSQSDDDFVEREPEPAFNPWGNYKKKK